MTVFLTILKILGIVLLSLLGLILFLVIVVLFAPIHYTSTGKYDDENKPLIEAKANWICHLVRFYFVLNGKEKDYYLKVLWFTLLPRDKRRKKEKRPSRDKTDSTDEALEKLNDSLSEEETGETETEGPDDGEVLKEDIEQESSVPAVSEDTGTDQEITEDQQSEEADEGSKKKKENRKRKSPVAKLKTSIRKFKFKFNRICDKIKAGKLKAEDIIEKLSDPRTEKAVYELLAELKKVLWHIRPRKFRLYLRYGFEDPSLTGGLYGIYNSFYGIHMGKPDVVPDFENKCFEGDYLVKGHLLLIVLLIAFLRLYFSKDVKRLWGIIKNR